MKKFLSLICVLVLLVGGGLSTFGQLSENDTTSPAFYSHIEKGERLESVYIEKDHDRHISQSELADRMADKQSQSDRAAKNFSLREVSYPGPFNEGDTRPFVIDGRDFGKTQDYQINSTLVAQGENSNIWILDDADFHAKTGTACNSECYLDDFTVDLAAEFAQIFDDVFARMTDPETGFAAFSGVKIETFYSDLQAVGDIAGDGKVNLVLHPMQALGYFWLWDYFEEANGMDMLHVNSEYIKHFIEGNEEMMLDFAATMAHEFQHLLFNMYFEIYYGEVFNETELTWFNESIAELAGTFYAKEGVEVSTFFYATVENAYGGTGYRDMLNWGGGQKNYGMGANYSNVLHKNFENAPRKLYQHFETTYPVATNEQEFENNCNKIKGMRQDLGDALHAVTGLGTGGGDTFDKYYFYFMENHAADGGVIHGETPRQTKPFYTSNLPIHNLWAYRVAAGDIWGCVFSDVETGNGYRGDAWAAYPTIYTGGQIALNGYGGSGGANGASHEMLYKISGIIQGANNRLKIAVPDDGNENTRYYVAVPNDDIQREGNNFWSLGESGADVFPLTKGEQRVVDIGSRQAYLYVVTLYQNVISTVSYTVEQVSLPVIQGVTVTGESEVGQVLTANVSYSEAVSQPDISFQWQQSTTGEGDWTDIAGATGEKFTITSEQADKFLRVTVTSNGTNVQAATFSSVATEAVEVAHLGTNYDPTVTASGLIYGASLGDSLLTVSGNIAGVAQWVDSTIVPTVVNGGYQVLFTPTNPIYSQKIIVVQVIVEKGMPATPKMGDDITVDSNKMYLSSISLPVGWKWQNPNAQIAAGFNSFDAIFEGDDNHVSTTRTISFYVKVKEVTNPIVYWIIAAMIVIVILIVLLLIFGARKRKKKTTYSYASSSQPSYYQPQYPRSEYYYVFNPQTKQYEPRKKQ